MKDPETGSDALRRFREFGLISRLTRDIEIKNESTLTGVGDDAAVLDYRDKKVVVTTDMLAEGIHFNLVYTPLKHLGYKTAVINFSDIYAMNATPKQLLVSIAVSGKFTVDMIEEVYSGIRLACDYYGVDLVGGDTASSLTGMVLSCTAIGECSHDMLVYRNGARQHDLICISGDLGAAYLGLQVLERERLIYEKHGDIQPVLEGYDYLLERQLKPEARYDIILLLKETGIKPTAMIDISDGLSSELQHICHASNTGCRIYSDKIPIHSETIRVAQEFNTEPLIAALNGGEDYELLFTVPVSEYDKVRSKGEISVIGHITDTSTGLYMVTESGTEVELKAQGWDNPQ